MKRVLLFLMVIGLATTVAFSQKKETRSVSGFTGINASSVFDITVTKDNAESLTIEADNEVMPYVRSEVKNGVLHLYLDNNKKLKNIKLLKASVSMKNLDKVTLSGACKFTANDLFTSEEFKGDCSGASKMMVNVNTGQLSIRASGANKIDVKANVTNNVKLDVSGTSEIRGEMQAARVKLSSSGVCSVELFGSATDIKIDVSGTSNVKAEDFIVKTANIESSGTSKVIVSVTDALKVNSSGASSINYKGSPTVEINSSGASKVRKI